MFNRVAFIDGNHLIYRAFFKFPRLKTLDGKPTSIIYGGPYILESLLRRIAPDKVIIVFDHSRSEFRKGLLPDYKQRESKLGVDKESFFQQRTELMELLTYMGLQVYQVKGYEADDIIAHLVKRYYKKGWESMIVSADKDFVQLINDRVLLFNVAKGIIIDKANCKRYYGYEPKHCVDYLCLCGDSSDNIKGYPGIGPKRAEALLNEYGSVRKFLKSDKKFGKVNRVMLKEIYETNRKLIDLMYFLRHVINPKDIVPINNEVNINMKKLEEICSVNQINFFRKPQFMKTFKDILDGN